MHIIVSAYGFWPPNDPRGSWSKCVHAPHLLKVGGPSTKVETVRSVASRPHDYQLRMRIKESMLYTPVLLSGRQAKAAAHGIANVLPKITLNTYAFAILPDHFHLVTGVHSLKPTRLIACLKQSATRGLLQAGLHPLSKHPKPNGKHPSPWAAGGWKVFLNSDDDMQRTIRYVEQNPVKEGLPRQQWSFVEEFES